MKKLVLVSTVAALALGVSACSKSDDATAAGNDVSILNDETVADTNLTATDGTIDNGVLANDAAPLDGPIDGPVDSNTAATTNAL